MTDGPAAVIAVGNRLRADDGAGVEVVRRLAGRVPAGVRLIELGGEPAGLLDAWDGLGTVVVVDAVRTGGEPGTVHRLDASTEPLPARMGSASTHGLGLAEALELGRALGRLPARVVVVGIEVADDRTVGGGLSRAVQDAIEGAAASVLAELERGRGRHAPHSAR
ncbi:MAG TPA: hydrogenase maturation protease [Solirubrobacteraceae bacterium]